eukprot:gnl/MRDRNA2_/MRDRNA2_82246_c0_seq2.p1 gnl/MRDRNA2_/MRDRNA2_82246_c0~~gnl/MRDRNA2_/MRDRNA2_82246_c0_seq2.p1  ORF type:complete len:396 (+),score=36.25 gnl/MRDRNA2_/MRDRNA2_82246_c0_seq2:62-1249(+)
MHQAYRPRWFECRQDNHERFLHSHESPAILTGSILKSQARSWWTGRLRTWWKCRFVKHLVACAVLLLLTCAVPCMLLSAQVYQTWGEPQSVYVTGNIAMPKRRHNNLYFTSMLAELPDRSWENFRNRQQDFLLPKSVLEDLRKGRLPKWPPPEWEPYLGKNITEMLKHMTLEDAMEKLEQLERILEPNRSTFSKLTWSVGTKAYRFRNINDGVLHMANYMYQRASTPDPQILGLYPPVLNSEVFSFWISLMEPKIVQRIFNPDKHHKVLNAIVPTDLDIVTLVALFLFVSRFGTEISKDVYGAATPNLGENHLIVQTTLDPKDPPYNKDKIPYVGLPVLVDAWTTRDLKYQDVNIDTGITMKCKKVLNMGFQGFHCRPGQYRIQPTPDKSARTME